MLAHRGNHFALPVDAFAGIGKKLNIAGRLHDRVNADGKFRKKLFVRSLTTTPMIFDFALVWRRFAAPRL